MRFGRPKPNTTKLQTSSGSVKDASRNRSIDWLCRYKPGSTVETPLIMLSHGGDGSMDGYKKSLAYIAEPLVNAGYVVVSVQHRKSKSETQHLIDRPTDVTFLLTEVLAGRANVRALFSSSVIGHIGHSAGSYTGIALAGGKYQQGTFKDSRILSFASLSPQGPGELGSTEDTWDNVTPPVYYISGTNEDRKNGKGWRRQAYENSPPEDIKFWSLVSGMDHDDLGRGGNSAQNKYVIDNVIAFFDWSLKSKNNLSEIGNLSFLSGTETSNTAEE